MSAQDIQGTFKTVGAHLLTAAIAALVTFFIAIGSYREKIDTIAVDNAKTQVSVSQLTEQVANLRLELVEVKTEMRLRRENQ